MGKIILASGSPRRRELLAQIGVSFTVEVSDADEDVRGDDPAEVVRQLALKKAEAVAGKHADEDVTVIGADTIVVYEGEILGKPEDAADARRMLRELAGNVHEVYTGVCVIRPGRGSAKQSAFTASAVREAGNSPCCRGDMGMWCDTFAECTKVYVAPMDDADIDAYIATGEPFDKAGSYGIQGAFARHIEKIDGDYFNVVGLPVGKLFRDYLNGRGKKTDKEE